MNENVRNNVFFHSASQFRESIMGFLKYRWKYIKDDMKNRINDNFQLIDIPVL